jgi:serine/threonine protein kinase
MPAAIGTRLGAYEILGRVGSGGMGEVYRARDTKLNRDCLYFVGQVGAVPRWPHRSSRALEAPRTAVCPRCQGEEWVCEAHPDQPVARRL